MAKFVMEIELADGFDAEYFAEWLRVSATNSVSSPMEPRTEVLVREVEA